MRHLARSSVSLCVSMLLAAACGSSDEQGPGGGSGGPGAGGAIILDPSGPLPPGANSRDGGSVALTPDQASALQNASCRNWAAAGEALPTALELVIDVSSSMNDDAPGTRQSKWEVTREALLRAIPGDGSAEFPGLDAGIPVGLLYYPNVQGGSQINATPGDIRGCVNIDAMTPIAPLGGPGGPQRSLVATSLNEVQLSTGTPTNDAYQYALDNGMLPFQFDGNRFMLLITDGTPTLSRGCVNPSGQLQGVNPQPIIDAVAAANTAHGIRTFVIGSPGSEDTREFLSAAARLGGTSSSPNCSDSGNPQYCHLDLTEEADFGVALREGLASVVGQIKSCTYEFPTAPDGMLIDPARVNVVVRDSDGTTSLLLPDETPEDCTVGFQLTADRRVVLCPETCGTVQADVKGSIELLFGCLADELVR